MNGEWGRERERLERHGEEERTDGRREREGAVMTRVLASEPGGSRVESH